MAQPSRQYPINEHGDYKHLVEVGYDRRSQKYETKQMEDYLNFMSGKDGNFEQFRSVIQQIRKRFFEIIKDNFKNADDKQKKLETAMADLEQQKKKGTELEAKIKHLESQIEKLESHNNRLGKQVELERSKATSLEESIKSLKQDLDGANARLNEKDQLEQEIAQRKERIEILETEMSELMTVYEESKQELEKMNESYRYLEGNSTQRIGELEDEIQRLGETIETLNKQNTDMEMDWKKKHEQVETEYNKTLNDLKTTTKELQTSLANIKELEDTIRSYKSEMENKRDEIQRFRKIQDESLQTNMLLENDIKKLRHDKDVLDQTNRNLLNELELLKKEATETANLEHDIVNDRLLTADELSRPSYKGTGEEFQNRSPGGVREISHSSTRGIYPVTRPHTHNKQHRFYMI